MLSIAPNAINTGKAILIPQIFHCFFFNNKNTKNGRIKKIPKKNPVIIDEKKLGIGEKVLLQTPWV